MRRPILGEYIVSATNKDNRVPSKPSESSFSAGGAERRSGVYSDVHEHSSTEPTNRKIDSEELRKNSNEKLISVSKTLRGFAAMPKDKVCEIARLGGRRRAMQVEQGGYVTLGRKGGRVRATQMSHGEFVAMGRMGGLSHREKATKRS
ncbi:MAG: hypothetical protein LBR89_01530 [Holosporales bacterium]|jgi:hypothetical protein|nr:hypothetical protein [Holosporales bacterium]